MSKKRKSNPRKPKVQRAKGYKPMTRKPKVGAGRKKIRSTSTQKYGYRK